MESTTVTLDTSGTVRFDVGGTLSMTTMDKRRWKRLWYFVTLRKPPVKIEYHEIIESDGHNTVTIKPKI